MKKLLSIGVVATLLLFTGCSQTEPSVDATNDSKKFDNIDTTVDVNDPSETNGLNNGGVDQSGTADGNELSLSGLEAQLRSITFAFDKFSIDGTNENKLLTNAALVNAKAAAYNVKLEGNCDEWGSDEYNYALGLKRAKAAKDAMVSEGVDATRITMVSFGESNPTCTEQTQACWAENRRVDFKLLP